MEQHDARSVAEVRRGGNHLAGEQSLYLRQHAHNPVDWYPWGDAALSRARAEDKPVFLSIGYSSCHWCHVMEREVFEDDTVAAYLNKHFIAIKVDREERPDLDAAYMEAVHVMAGSGGWPLNVFLTPGLAPFFGATYVPAPNFLRLLREVVRGFTADPGRIEQFTVELKRALNRDPVPLNPGRETELSGLPALGVASAWEHYDPEWGGFGAAQKFPCPPRLALLLHHFRRTGDGEVRNRLVQTLGAIASGGLRDHLGGGFHRYCVDPAWTVPHFEKMLYDNAQLASLYLESAAALVNSEYAEVGRETLDFLLREMRDDGGGFFASFDADSGGEEGTYYVWTPAELESVAGPRDAAVLAGLLGVTDGGNFEGANVLTRRADPAVVADSHGRPLDEVLRLLGRWRSALLAARSQRTAPVRDPKVVTAWNAMAVCALVDGYSFFLDDRYLMAAQDVAGWLWEHHRLPEGALARASTDGTTAGPGVLDDYAWSAAAWLKLFRATGRPDCLDHARELVDYVMAHFAHPRAGFYLTPDTTPAPLGRRCEVFESVEPSGNAVMLRVLRELHALDGTERHRETGESMLHGFATLLERAGLETATWLDEVLHWTAPSYTAVVAGDESAGVGGLRHRIGELLAGYALVVPAVEGLPLAQDKSAGDGPAQVWICGAGSCHPPVADIETALGLLRRGWFC